MQNTLLIQAIPYEDESPISFLLRTAKLNAHSSISNLVGKENYQLFFQFFMKRYFQNVVII